MSEIDNSTLVESAMEMQPIEAEPPAVTEEVVVTEVATPSVSNQEAMTALLLSRVKKQSKQIENLTRIAAQVPSQVRTIERAQSRQVKLLSRQLRILQNQVRQVQKQVGRIKVSSAKSRKRRVARKARKTRAKRR
jgi:hypothetical protein